MKLASGGLAVAVATFMAAAAAAQTQGAQLYAFHTGRMGACPGLDWHLTVEPDNKLVGLVMWDRNQHMARVDGQLNSDRTFRMNVQEVGGQNRSAVVSGTARGDYINAQIEGAGGPCDGKTLQIPRVVGGAGGGG